MREGLHDRNRRAVRASIVALPNLERSEIYSVLGSGRIVLLLYAGQCLVSAGTAVLPPLTVVAATNGVSF